MKTGLSKKQKATNIYFNEDSPIIEVCTYNTDLKNRLTKYAAQYPSECKLIDDDKMGCMTFEISKGRFGFKLTAPYSVFIWMNESLQFHYCAMNPNVLCCP